MIFLYCILITACISVLFSAENQATMTYRLVKNTDWNVCRDMVKNLNKLQLFAVSLGLALSYCGIIGFHQSFPIRQMDAFSKVGHIATYKFYAPIEGFYQLRLQFINEEPFNRHSELFKYLSGVHNSQDISIIPVHIILSRLIGEKEELLYDKQVSTQGIIASGVNDNIVGITSFYIKPGKYKIKMINLQEHPQLKNIQVNVLLTCGIK